MAKAYLMSCAPVDFPWISVLAMVRSKWHSATQRKQSAGPGALSADEIGGCKHTLVQNGTDWKGATGKGSVAEILLRDMQRTAAENDKKVLGRFAGEDRWRFSRSNVLGTFAATER
jgi:hypothetical protein